LGVSRKTRKNGCKVGSYLSELNKTEILGGLLKRLGNFSPGAFERSFDERLIFQKTVYLLQSFGIYLGFSFSWYIRGPYCPLLAKYGYDLAKCFDRLSIVRFTNATLEQRFVAFVSFLNDRKNNAECLETLGSIHFLRDTYSGMKKSQILQMVQTKQPYLTIQQCEEAWDYLIEHKLIEGQ
jgi:uncharacterized protein YwgA